MRQDLLAQAQLVGDAREGQERQRVAHGEAPATQIRLNDLRQTQEAQRVRNGRSVTTDATGELLLRPAELGQQLLIRLGLFQRVQVLAQEVLHERHLEALAI